MASHNPRATESSYNTPSPAPRVQRPIKDRLSHGAREMRERLGPRPDHPMIDTGECHVCKKVGHIAKNCPISLSLYSPQPCASKSTRQFGVTQNKWAHLRVLQEAWPHCRIMLVNTPGGGTRGRTQEETSNHVCNRSQEARGSRLHQPRIPIPGDGSDLQASPPCHGPQEANKANTAYRSCYDAIGEESIIALGQA